MKQGVLPFQYEQEKSTTYLELMHGQAGGGFQTRPYNVIPGR